MSQGIYVRMEKGELRFFPMRDRADVGDPDLQRALPFCRHHRGTVCCACCEEMGQLIPMDVVKVATPAPPPGIVCRVDRVSIADPHHPACIFRLPDDDMAYEPPVPSSLMFLERGPMPSAAGVGLGRGGRGSMRFVSFARALMSAGYTRVWVSANEAAPSFREFRNPSALEILEAIDGAIRGIPLRDARDAYQGAEMEGAGFVFGLCEAALPAGPFPESGPDVPLLLAGFRQGGLDNFYARAPAQLIEKLRRSVQVGRQHVSPPYLFFAVIEPDWKIRKLCIQPVHFDGIYLVFAESGLERRYFACLLGEGAAFYRELDSMRDYEAMPPHLQVIALQPGEHWPFCPDAIIYGEPTSRIEELRGFKKGKFRDYDDLLERKGTDYPKFVGSRASVDYRERDESSLGESETPTDGPESGSGLPRLRRGLVAQELPRLLRVPADGV